MSELGSEKRLRSALTERAGSIRVDDPRAGVTKRIAALRHRRRRRIAAGSATIVTVVAALALSPMIFDGGNSGETATQSTRSDGGSQAGVLSSSLVRDTRPTVPQSTLDELTAATTSTAIDLYNRLATTPGNVFFSPYSVETALSMAAAGAQGETLAQMLALLHNELPTKTFHDATNRLNLALLAPRTAPSGSNVGASGKALELEIANSIWGQTGYHIEPGFLDLLARDYGAALNAVDFGQDATGATKTINRWVDAHTSHKIKKLFEKLDPATRLVLVNAVHFKASWQQPFDPAATRDGQFATATGSTVTVPFMHGVKEKTPYASGAGWQAVDLPYVGDASMTVIVPDAGTFASFERSLDPALLARIVGAMNPSEVTLALPKLELKDKVDFVPQLKALGMKDAFTPGADFSGITGTRELHISQVVHQATVTIDEKGTEAAAATGVAFEQSASPRVTLSVDRPYLMLIRDQKTGTILFLGRVTDPTQTSVQQ